jgi:tetratricopeptide (TPR) repeat protein/transcriptional regulator with XRE-family HTH domain
MSADPLSALGDELKRLLAAKRWGVDALARRAGLGRTVVSRALNGREVPTIRTITLLAAALGADVAPLLKLRKAAGATVAKIDINRTPAPTAPLIIALEGDSAMRGPVRQVVDQPVGAAVANESATPQDLDDQRDRRPFTHTAAIAVVGDIPGKPIAFQVRPLLSMPLQNDTAGPGTCLIHLITGMLGVGKTQAAAAYARECITAKWRLVAWVGAEDAATMADGLAASAIAVGLQPGADQVATAKALRHWLEADGERCLVVFDNALDPDILRPFLPSAGRAHIIATSTNNLVAGLGTNIRADVFSLSEAVNYLGERTGHTDVEGARELANEVGCLPLALAQAAAVVTSQRLGYTIYLERLRAFPVEIYLPRTKLDPYPRAVCAAILISIQTAQAADGTGLAIRVLSCLALLSPTGVPRCLLHGIVSTASRGAADLVRAQEHHGWRAHVMPEAAGINESAVDAVLAQLNDASVLNLSEDGLTVTCHRLVMRVIREQRAHGGLIAADATEAIGLLKTAAQAAEPPWEHSEAARSLAQQVIDLSSHLMSYLPDSSTESTQADLLELRKWAFKSLGLLGDNSDRAIRLGEPLLADLERLFGDTDPQTVNIRDNLANVYHQAGRLPEAISLHERALTDYQRTLGDDHEDTLSARHNLASAYQAAGRLAEAIPMHERTLAERIRILGADHQDVLASQGNLACAYQTAGRLDDATALLKINLATCERALGTDHPYTLASRHNLASVYQEAGRLTDAIPMYERLLAECERVLGADNPHTLDTKHSLATAYHEAGRRNEAIALLQQTLADRERKLGKDHPDTQGTRDTLAVIAHSTQI